MTAAFARELGLAVRFQSVGVDDSWSRSNGLYLVSTHINLAIGAPPVERIGVASSPAMLVVDFLKRPAAVPAYNTLALIYQRHGNLALAEQVIRAALVREPENLLLLRNLQPVLAAQGKHLEAGALARQLAAIEPTPPSCFFNQGVKAYEKGQYVAAKALSAREVKRMPYFDEFHFWLALAFDTSTRSATRDLYAGKLAHLRSLAAEAPVVRYRQVLVKTRTKKKPRKGLRFNVPPMMSSLSSPMLSAW